MANVAVHSGSVRAENARASATSAGKDAVAAAQDYLAAFKSAVEKQQAEEEQYRETEEAWRQAPDPEGTPPDDGDDEGSWVPDWLKGTANTVVDHGSAILTNSDIWSGAGETFLGIVQMVGGAGTDVGGGGLCISGVGCLAGAPAIAVGSGLVVSGAFTAGDGISIKQEHSEALTALTGITFDFDRYEYFLDVTAD